VSYAAAPTPEYRAASVWEAAAGLGRFLGVSTARAAAMLDDGSAAVEIRARRADPRIARRLWERRYMPPLP
jgi:hypothetical protein